MPDLVHEAVDRGAVRDRNHPAVVMGDEALTYGELLTATNQLANSLIELGAQRGDRVGLYLHKSVETVVSAYGIMKAGCAFVPIDPLIPTERLEIILDDCGINIIVTENRLVPRLGAVSPSLSAVVGPTEKLAGSITQLTWADVHDRPTGAPTRVVTPDDLAYVMYTSGSTGTPKGMMHSHHTSLGFGMWGVDYCGLVPSDRVASHGPLHFDISIFDIFSTGLAGATVVLVPEAVTKFPASLSALLADQHVTVIFTVPFALSQLANNGALVDRDLSSLRWVLFGGEPFTPRHLRTLMLALPNAKFANVYGPAEAPACVCHVVADPPQDDTPIPIGTVSPETTATVDTAGALTIEARSVTLGYWNRPELNEQSLVRRGVFRTGDLVRVRADGIYEFVGRSDRMVKTRGFRVELDEIESAMNAHDDISESAAFAITDEDGVTLVHAAFVGTIEEAHLRSYLADRLPNYAIPVSLRSEVAFPRTTSDKIDRPALAQATRRE